MKNFFLLALCIAFPILIIANEPVDTTTQHEVTEDQAVSKPTWNPPEQDQLMVKFLSYQYLNARYDGDFNRAYAAFSESTKLATDFKQWKRTQLLFNATAGAEIDTQFTRITWYENPPTEALPGIFAAIDYSGVFTNVELQCGNLLWHKKADGHFELIREQEHFIDKASQAKLTPNEITQLKVQFGCKQP